MGRWLRTSGAVLALALVGCAHPSPAPAPPVATQASPAPPSPHALAAPPPPVRPPGPCLPPQLKELQDSIPPCVGAPPDVFEATRIKKARPGGRVSVRGFLVIRQWECTLKACETVDRKTGERRREPCCNGCNGFWRLAGPDEARANSGAWGGTQIFVRREGNRRPLDASGLDCVMDAIAASPREEIIATGLLEISGLGGDLGPGASSSLAIDDATLCATGRWIPPRANADGGLPVCP